MKVLLSALACEPGKGSEPEVGFRTLLAAASRHEVWVLTLPESIPAIRRELDGDPRGARVHLESITFESKRRVLKDLTSWEFHRAYDRWQRDARDRALDLDQEVGFDGHPSRHAGQLLDAGPEFPQSGSRWSGGRSAAESIRRYACCASSDREGYWRPLPGWWDDRLSRCYPR